ncbi:replication initiator [Nonomuraea africana]|uniref:replication initiator n=1 Tax=Nonomuraea africana TaxID=46171 RepID=UPI0033E4814E
MRLYPTHHPVRLRRRPRRPGRRRLPRQVLHQRHRSHRPRLPATPPDTIDLYANPHGTHPERLIAAAWTLARAPGWTRLRRWAHMLGFGGHFLTKARR